MHTKQMRTTGGSLRTDYNRCMQWYPSKVDRWLAAALAIGPLVSVGAAIAAIVNQPEAAWIALVPVVLVIAVYAGLLFPMRYGVGDAELVVRYGLVRTRIALRDIELVEPTRSLLSSPALSLDRLRVQFGSGWRAQILISPADKAGFLANLAERAGLTRDGDRHVRQLPSGASS